MKENRTRPGLLGKLRFRMEGMFTRQERAALLFLIGVSLLGLALMAWRRVIPAEPTAFLQLEIHVNRASASELTSLPGIGPILAQRIVEDRKRHGRFLTLEDLKRVKGVSAKTLEKLQGLVHFD